MSSYHCVYKILYAERGRGTHIFLFLSVVTRRMDDILYFHPRCGFSKDLIKRVQRLPRLAAQLRPIDVSIQRPRHRIAEVPCIIYQGRMYQGREAFWWLTTVAPQEGAASDAAGDGTLPASECSMYSDASTLRFVDFNAERPTITLAPESYCSF